MKKYVVMLFVGAALAGCSESKEAPEGQVVATVGDQEITTSELKLEMAQLPASAQAKAQPQALNSIVNRKLLATAAVERGLDKTPMGAMMLQKARELALIGLLQQSIAENAPKPSADEIKIFMTDNPQAFADRNLVIVDQWAAPEATPQVVKAMEPLNTIEPILKLLDDNHVAYQRGFSSIDTLNVPKDAAGKIGQMKAGDVFLTPAAGGIMISRIREIVPQPLSGADATNAATNLLKQQRSSGLVQKQIEEMETDGQSKVKLNPSFKLPPKAPAAQ